MIRALIDKWLSRWEQKLMPINLIEISRQTLLANYDKVKKEARGKEVWPVLKANAYGSGLEPVVEILKARRFRYVVVDSYYEALKVWKVSRRQKVLLIGPMLPVNYSKIDWDKVTIMVQSPDQIRELSATGKRIRVHLKINSGMNRQGVDIDEIAEVIKVIKMSNNIELEGLMSHLAEADNLDNKFNKIQEINFKKAIEKVKKEGLRPKYYHLEATAGIGKVSLGDLNAVRLGLGLYIQVIRLKSAVIKIRKVKKGEKIGYGLTYQFEHDSWVGIVPVGYYEGLDRRLSNRGVIKYEGKYYPIVGNICMNMCLVNFGQEKPMEYGEVELIGTGGENSFDVMAEKCGTISGELMVDLNESTRRVIV